MSKTWRKLAAAIAGMALVLIERID